MKEGWQKLTLGEAFATTTGGTPPKTEYSLYGDYIPFVKPPELNDTTIEAAADGLSQDGAKVARTLPVNSILVSCIGNLGKIGLNTIPVAFNQQINAILPNEKIALPWFMFYQVLGPAFKDQLQVQASGTTVPIVNKSKFNSIAIVLPEIKEQHRIVTLLDKAFADIATAKANAEKNLQNARDLFNSHLQSIFTIRGEDWVEKRLGDIGKVSMCKRIFKEQTTPTGEIPFYKIGTFGKQADAFIPAEIYQQFRQKYSFPNKGDVLVSAAGTVGRCVVYDGEDAYFQDSNIVWIANDQTKILNHFLYHFYGSCDWNSTQGATISRLYNDNLRQIVIAFPQSLDEQKSIATQLDVLTDETNRLTDIYRQKLTALDNLKKSLLHQAFSGQL